MEKGDYVIEICHGHEGLIKEIYENWQDLKSKQGFVTIAPDADEMDNVEMLVHGDPRDKWLEMQSIPFTKEQLNERWGHVLTVGGGSIYSCESRLRTNNNI